MKMVNARCTKLTGLQEPVHGRRRRPELRVANYKILRNGPVRRPLHPPRPRGRRWRRWARPTGPTTTCSTSRGAPTLKDALHRQLLALNDEAIEGVPRPSTRSPYEFIEDDDEFYKYVAQALADGEGLRLVPGRLRVGPARPGRALDHRRPAPVGDEGEAQRDDQVPRGLPALRPLGPRGARRRSSSTSPTPSGTYPARFMLYVCPGAAEEKRSVLPAITHEDGSGRLQTVYHETNPGYHADDREAFGELTDVPVVMNTSFNLKGEPIVEVAGPCLQHLQPVGDGPALPRRTTSSTPTRRRRSPTPSLPPAARR